MSLDSPDHHLLLLIHERLDVIEGKVTLIARAEKEAHLEVIRNDVMATPGLADVYLAVNGKSTQDEIRIALGLTLATASRRFTALRKLGVVRLLESRKDGKVYGRDLSAEEILDLSAHMSKWKTDIEKTATKKAQT